MLSHKKAQKYKKERLDVEVRSELSSETTNGVRVDRFSSAKGALEVRLSDVNFAVRTSILASGDSALGRGVHGSIPLHLIFEAENLKIEKSLKYKLVLREI